MMRTAKDVGRASLLAAIVAGAMLTCGCGSLNIFLGPRAAAAERYYRLEPAGKPVETSKNAKGRSTIFLRTLALGGSVERAFQVVNVASGEIAPIPNQQWAEGPGAMVGGLLFERLAKARPDDLVLRDAAAGEQTVTIVGTLDRFEQRRTIGKPAEAAVRMSVEIIDTRTRRVLAALLIEESTPIGTSPHDLDDEIPADAFVTAMSASVSRALDQIIARVNTAIASIDGQS